VNAKFKVTKIYSLSHGMQNSCLSQSSHSTLLTTINVNGEYEDSTYLYWLIRWLPSPLHNPLITCQWQISHGSPSPTLTKMMPTGAIHGIQTIYLHTMG